MSLDDGIGAVVEGRGNRGTFHGRLLTFVKVVFVFEAAIFALRVAVLAALGRADEIPRLGTFVSLIALGLMGCAWAALSAVKLRRGWQRRAADLTVLLALAIPTAGLVALDDPSNVGAASAASGLGIFLVLRGALVATPGRETALVTGLSALGAFLCFEGFALARGVAYFDAGLRLALGLATFVALAVVCSSIVYGLRREVDAARRIGRYEVDSELGRGGMGVVYRAHHALMQRPTAIKVLPAAAMDPEGVARFEREVRVTARLEHPNTIAVYDYGRSTDGSLYYAMELVDGLDLHHLVAKYGPMPPGRVVHVLDQMLGSLAEAHANGLVHRDVKPGNALLAMRGGEPDVVKVLDFGLAKNFAEATNLTMGGQVLGTPLYMAPEMMRGATEALPASDLYGVAATGYFLLTGTHLYSAPSKRELLRQVLEEMPEPPSRRRGEAVPPDLEATILRGLAKAPGDRFADADAFRAALRECDVPRWTREDGIAWWRDVRGAAPRSARPGAEARPPDETTRRAIPLDLESRPMLRGDAAPGGAARGQGGGPADVP